VSAGRKHDTGPLIAELAKLRDESERSAFVKRHKRRLLTPGLVEELADEVRKRVRVDMHEALHLAEGAVLIAGELGAPESKALSFRAKANALYILGQNQAAVELHEQAIALFRQCGNTTELGRSLSGSVQPLSLQGQYDRAFANVEEARAIFAAEGDWLRLARLDINFGNILHRQDRFDEALKAYRRAYDALWPDKDIEGIAVVLHNIAVCLIGLNDFHQALDTYTRAREFCRQHSMPLLVLQSDYNIAQLYYLRGEYGRAISSLLTSREASRNIGDDHHFALCHLDLSEIYVELNLSTEAAQTAQDAYFLFEKLGMNYEAAKCLLNHAVALSQQGKPFAAIELFAKARDLFAKEQNRVWPAVLDLYQALVYYNEGRFFEARRLTEAAVELFRGSLLPGKTVLSQLLLARLALRTGDQQEAHRWCTQAIDLAAELKSPILQYQSALVMGNILEASGRRVEACESYEAAHVEMEALRSSLGSDEMKVAFMGNKFEVYERLVDLCLDGVVAPGAAESGRSQAAQAFCYIEQAKSRSLRDLIFGRLHNLPGGNEGKSDLVRKIRDLREELNWYYNRIEIQQLGRSEASATQIEQLREQAAIREQHLARVLRESSAGPQDGLQASNVAPIEDIQAMLPDDTALLEYFRIGDRLVAAIVTRTNLDVFPLTVVSRILPLMRMLQFQMAKVARGASFAEGTLPAIQGHLRSVYEEVLAPLRYRLEGSRRLVIVPHDILHYVPFQALLDGDRYLVDSYSISYAPSASVFALCQSRTVQPFSRSLIMGVPDQRAPYIGDEVLGIAGLLPDADLFLGQQATVAVFKERGETSRYIHVATHGHFRQDNPLFSGVRLSDAYLDVYDLYHLRLPAELITMSGCATGLNVLAKGDELLGLERGLLYAGAQALLLSLWDVNDLSTSQFMTSFYRNLARGEGKADALRMASVELRHRYPNPYYWAPFVLIGKGFDAAQT
jgi:CHAT domain-containing protein/Tfp pilus assembly protein PilF